MRMRSKRAGVSLAAALVAGLAMPLGAQADDAHPGQENSGLSGKITGAGSGSAMGAAGNNTVSTGQGGVGGTGLGKVPQHDATGTGNSVPGPPGQLIQGGMTTKPNKNP